MAHDEPTYPLSRIPAVSIHYLALRPSRLPGARDLLLRLVREECDAQPGLHYLDAGAVHAFLNAGIPFGPGKAENAGGVAVSGPEQSQNALRQSWSREEVDGRSKAIMTDIHSRCAQYGTRSDGSVAGANIAEFVKVAEAMLAYGLV